MKKMISYLIGLNHYCNLRSFYDEFDHYYAAIASRRDEFAYLHTDDELLKEYRDYICNHGRYAKVFSDAMGDRYFMAKFKSLEEVEKFRDYAEARI